MAPRPSGDRSALRLVDRVGGRWFALLFAATPVVVGACGGDGPSDDDRAEVVLALGFLADEWGYTTAQVECVQADLEEHVSGDDLSDWSRTLRRIDRGDISVADLEGEQGEVLVGAISRCAVEPS